MVSGRRRFNDRVNCIQEPASRIVYNDKSSSSEELLDKYSFVLYDLLNLQDIMKR